VKSSFNPFDDDAPDEKQALNSSYNPFESIVLVSTPTVPMQNIPVILNPRAPEALPNVQQPNFLNVSPDDTAIEFVSMLNDDSTSSGNRIAAQLPEDYSNPKTFQNGRLFSQGKQVEVRELWANSKVSEISPDEANEIIKMLREAMGVK
jgi:hypothetical protein